MYKIPAEIFPITFLLCSCYLSSRYQIYSINKSGAGPFLGDELVFHRSPVCLQVCLEQAPWVLCSCSGLRRYCALRAVPPPEELDGVIHSHAIGPEGP